jgi:hypothetical protein
MHLLEWSPVGPEVAPAGLLPVLLVVEAVVVEDVSVVEAVVPVVDAPVVSVVDAVVVSAVAAGVESEVVPRNSDTWPSAPDASRPTAKRATRPSANFSCRCRVRPRFCLLGSVVPRLLSSLDRIARTPSGYDRPSLARPKTRK